MALKILDPVRGCLELLHLTYDRLYLIFCTSFLGILQVAKLAPTLVNGKTQTSCLSRRCT